MRWLQGWKIVFIASSLLAAATSFATIYQSVGKDGSLIFSDRPQKNSKPVKLSPSSQFQAVTPAKSTKTPTPKTQAIHPGYQRFDFAKLKNQQTFQNQPQIPLQLNLQPKLQGNDQIQLLVDGKPYGKTQTTTKFILDNLDRGTHQIQAYVLDKQGEIVKKTPSLTIYIHYPTLFTPTRSQ